MDEAFERGGKVLVDRYEMSIQRLVSVLLYSVRSFGFLRIETIPASRPSRVSITHLQ